MDAVDPTVFRLAIFAPNLVGQVFVGILFSMLFTPRYGLFNRFLHALIGWGLEEQWLTNPSLVMPAVGATGFVFGGPGLHLSHGRPGIALLDLGLRVGLTVGGLCCT